MKGASLPGIRMVLKVNIWNQETRKVVYNQDVVFRELKYVTKHDVLPMEPQKDIVCVEGGRIRLYSRTRIKR